MAVRAPKRAVFLVAALLAAGLAGCEYADDVGPAPSAGGRTGSGVAPTVPLSSAGPALMAEMDRNMAAVELLLADVPVGAGGAAGGISGRSGAGGGFAYNGVLTRAGTYTVVAVCVGAAEAQLAVLSRGTSEGSYAIDVPCGEPVTQQLELGTGPVTAHLVSPDEERIYKAAVGAVRISDPAP
ncbi:hypothetical protein [Arthrobacter sp. Y81]|uniref:hypothetical protein n=1 Tax=Arthrobacter sp. Y81 TaxID=2058897 RepID=UPI000CE3B59F|nr:hypothetical protein [Arthrobacter sp. Y81]